MPGTRNICYPSAVRRLLAAALVVLMLAGPARAGKLDLDIYGQVRLPAAARPRPDPVSTPVTWTPGDPRDLRSAPRSVQGLATGTYAALGVAGFVACVAAAPAAAAGFAVMAAVNLYRLYRVSRARV